MRTQCEYRSGIIERAIRIFLIHKQVVINIMTKMKNSIPFYEKRNMISQTSGSAGYEIGIKFGSESTINVNGKSLTAFIDEKQDKSTLLQDIYPIDSVICLDSDVSPSEFIADTTWTKLGKLDLSEDVSIYFWKRTD